MMSHMIGMNLAHVIAQRNGCKLTGESAPGSATYYAVFKRGEVEVGRTMVEKFDASGFECVSMNALHRIFPADRLVD